MENNRRLILHLYLGSYSGAVNSQYYTNYPTGNLIYYSYVWNWTALATIQPTSANPIVAASTTVSNTATLYTITIAAVVISLWLSQ